MNDFKANKTHETHHSTRSFWGISWVQHSERCCPRHCGTLRVHEIHESNIITLSGEPFKYTANVTDMRWVLSHQPGGFQLLFGPSSHTASCIGLPKGRPKGCQGFPRTLLFRAVLLLWVGCPARRHLTCVKLSSLRGLSVSRKGRLQH